MFIESYLISYKLLYKSEEQDCNITRQRRKQNYLFFIYFIYYICTFFYFNFLKYLYNNIYIIII